MRRGTELRGRAGAPNEIYERINPAGPPLANPVIPMIAQSLPVHDLTISTSVPTQGVRENVHVYTVIYETSFF